MEHSCCCVLAIIYYYYYIFMPFLQIKICYMENSYYVFFFFWFEFLLLQRIPQFSLRTIKNISSSYARPSMIGLKDPCPSGTIPIRRTTKEDLIAIRSLSNNIHPQSATNPGVYASSLLYILERRM